MTDLPDNQYRNKEVCNLIDRIIKAGKKVVLFPKTVPWKDLNDMVTKGGMTTLELHKLIARNTFQGLSAQNIFSTLRKV